MSGLKTRREFMERAGKTFLYIATAPVVFSLPGCVQPGSIRNLSPEQRALEDGFEANLVNTGRYVGDPAPTVHTGKPYVPVSDTTNWATVQGLAPKYVKALQHAQTVKRSVDHALPDLDDLHNECMARFSVDYKGEGSVRALLEGMNRDAARSPFISAAQNMWQYDGETNSAFQELAQGTVIPHALKAQVENTRTAYRTALHGIKDSLLIITGVQVIGGAYGTGLVNTTGVLDNSIVRLTYGYSPSGVFDKTQNQTRQEFEGRIQETKTAYIPSVEGLDRLVRDHRFNALQPVVSRYADNGLLALAREGFIEAFDSSVSAYVATQPTSTFGTVMTRILPVFDLIQSAPYKNLPLQISGDWDLVRRTVLAVRSGAITPPIFVGDKNDLNWKFWIGVGKLALLGTAIGHALAAAGGSAGSGSAGGIFGGQSVGPGAAGS